jgi:hypothetical protein
MSADDVKAAMRAAEDEGDAAAAVAVEREAAEEMEEFVKVGGREVHEWNEFKSLYMVLDGWRWLGKCVGG